MQGEIGACANNFCESNGQFTEGRLYVAIRAGTRYLVVIKIQTDNTLLGSKPTRKIFLG